MASFSKFNRPGTPRNGVITERDLDIIEAVLRYRFSPTSELVRLVGGNEKVTLRRLRQLWECGHLNRFAFPGTRNHSEFTYYLDTTKALDLLVQHGRAAEIHPQMEEEIRLNREADYAGAVLRGQHMKLGFLQHSLMISRLHFMLEMASRQSDSAIQLSSWRQGPDLRGHKAEVPEMKSRRVEGSNTYIWEEHDNRTQRLPVEPDALFSLRFPNGRVSHFCYEADRGTMPLADMLKKLRAYNHFIKRQQKHKEAFGVHPIRAVLIETTDEARARKLMELVQHAAVIGEGKRAGLFWFCISPILTMPADNESPPVPRYLVKPALILDRLWALPDFSLHALADAENFQSSESTHR
jgi:Replication-relaxation